jgi:dolichol-phosphate hexosyltransferase
MKVNSFSINPMKKITILIPCHNEERGIGKVIDSIPTAKLKSQGYDSEIIVINNNCTDRTEQIAKEKGAKIICENKKGKGHALRRGFDAVSKDTQYVVMLDGDNTYKGCEIIRLVEPLESNFADVVIGSRLGGKLKKNSLKFQNRIANWAYTFLVRHFYYANTTDVLSGYFAWKKEVVDELKQYIESDGFSIEMEMITKMVKLGFYICSVPITYDRREGESKIEAIKDGLHILYMFFKNLFWCPRKHKARLQTELA